MRSIAFPDMFSGTKTNVVYDKKALFSNVKLIVLTSLGELFGDPGYGNNLQSITFATNNVLLVDIIKQTLCECMARYIPQVIINRDDIDVVQNLNTVTITMRFYNDITKEFDAYSIDLMSDGEDQKTS